MREYAARERIVEMVEGEREDVELLGGSLRRGEETGFGQCGEFGRRGGGVDGDGHVVEVGALAGRETPGG